MVNGFELFWTGFELSVFKKTINKAKTLYSFAAFLKRKAH